MRGYVCCSVLLVSLLITAREVVLLIVPLILIILLIGRVEHVLLYALRLIQPNIMLITTRVLV